MANGLGTDSSTRLFYSSLDRIKVTDEEVLEFGHPNPADALDGIYAIQSQIDVMKILEGDVPDLAEKLSLLVLI